MNAQFANQESFEAISLLEFPDANMPSRCLVGLAAIRRRPFQGQSSCCLRQALLVDLLVLQLTIKRSQYLRNCKYYQEDNLIK